MQPLGVASNLNLKLLAMFKIQQRVNSNRSLNIDDKTLSKKTRQRNKQIIKRLRIVVTVDSLHVHLKKEELLAMRQVIFL